MLAQALDADKDFAGFVYEDGSYYDSCGTAGETADWQTNWTILLKFNAFLYLALACIMLFTILGSCFAPFFCCTCIGLTCGSCAHLALIIVTGIFRFNTEGKLCAENDELVSPDGMTYAEHGQRIKALFISQCVFLIFVNICQICAC